MGVKKSNPRYNVVSLRITDEEQEVLRHIMKKQSKNISDILREAIFRRAQELRGTSGCGM